MRPLRGLWAILGKEFRQMARDAGTLRFALFVPVFQLVLFGLIDTNVRLVPTVVFDQSRSAASRELLDDFVNSSYFQVVGQVSSRAALRAEIVAHHAQVGIEIPPDYGRRRLAGRPADVLVLIDGSDSSIASQALSAANGVALSRSLEQLGALGGGRGGGGGVDPNDLPISVRPTMLFNPDSRSANLLIPGLIAILLTFSATFLASFGIVRERERGTLEQLMVTPASPIAVVTGKLLPYLALAFVQLLLILVLMTTVFGVPIHGSIGLLLGLSTVYLMALLALGLLVSSRAKTQMEAVQMAQIFLLPSIMLSGYIFPLSSLPGPLRVLSQVLPATHFIEISRGIVIRGASFHDLWEHTAALLVIALVLVALSARAFRKTIS